MPHVPAPLLCSPASHQGGAYGPSTGALSPFPATFPRTWCPLSGFITGLTTKCSLSPVSGSLPRAPGLPAASRQGPRESWGTAPRSPSRTRPPRLFPHHPVHTALAKVINDFRAAQTTKKVLALILCALTAVALATAVIPSSKTTFSSASQTQHSPVSLLPQELPSPAFLADSALPVNPRT